MKAIIFDVDDTLIEWKKEFIFALKNTLKEINYECSENTILKIDKALNKYEKSTTKYSKENFLKFINDTCNTNLPLDFVDKLIIAQGSCVYDDSKLIDTIEYLASKYDLFVITNWFTETQKTRLKKMGILKYFKEVIGFDKNFIKPHKKSFDIILNNYKYDEYISIGNTLESDILLPISLGMTAYWKTDEISNKYNTFKSIYDLKVIL